VGKVPLIIFCAYIEQDSNSVLKHIVNIIFNAFFVWTLQAIYIAYANFQLIMEMQTEKVVTLKLKEQRISLYVIIFENR
jgi:hypothetical protein